MAQNFIYDVLEPIKVPINPHRDVGILIDIKNETDEQSGLELSGSDLDNVKKAEFDLVDLYQNIYVTPQHVRKAENAVDMLNVGYNEFFEKSEAEEKIDWNISQSVLKKSPLNAVIDEIDNRSNESSLEEDESIDKSSFNYRILNNHNITRILKAPTINDIDCEIGHDIKKEIENSIIGNAINKLEINNSTTFNCEIQKRENCTTSNSLPINFLNVDKLKRLSGTCPIDKTFNHNNVPMLDKPLKNMNLNKGSQSLLQNLILNQSVGTGIVCNNQHKNDIETMKTVTLDKKTYAKQRQIKSELEKLGFTKGPELYEKSVVLPQIMKRLAVRKKALEEDGKLQRRLILDSRKQECQCQCVQKITPAKQTNVKARELGPDKIKQTSIHSSMKAGPSSSQNNSQNGIKLNPILVFENCNSERLIAHRVHSAFEKFVRTGSYY